MKKIIQLVNCNGSVIALCEDGTTHSLSDNFKVWTRLPDIFDEIIKTEFKLNDLEKSTIFVEDIDKVSSENIGVDRANQHIVIDILYLDGTYSRYIYGKNVDSYYCHRTPHQVETRDKDFKELCKVMRSSSDDN